MSIVKKATALGAAMGLALVVTGCGTDNVIGGDGPVPGVAASVNDETLTIDELDDVVDDYCALYVDYPQADPYPKSFLRRQLVASWVDATAVEQLADEAGIAVPEATDGQVEEAWAQLGEVDDDNRATFALLTRIQSLVQDALVQLGQEDLGEDGPATQEAADRGLELVRGWLAEQDVTVNPTFGSVTDGTVGTDPEELSLAVSDVAREATAQEWSPEYLADLPAVQRCGPESAPAAQVPLG